MEAKVTLEEFSTNSATETEEVASKFSLNVKLGDVIALYGNLGAGKSVFVKGLARGLGVKGQITSPTFVFEKRYPIKIGGKAALLHHLDLYRGDSISELLSLGLEEIFQGESIVVLEWADKIKENLPKKRIDIFIETVNEKKRKIRINRN